jgi:hypothetical protein
MNRIVWAIGCITILKNDGWFAYECNQNGDVALTARAFGPCKTAEQAANGWTRKFAR